MSIIQEFRAFCARSIGIGIDQHEDQTRIGGYRVRMKLQGCQLDGPDQFVFLNQLGSGASDWPDDFDELSTEQLTPNAFEQGTDRFVLTMSLDDRCDAKPVHDASSSSSNKLCWP